MSDAMTPMDKAKAKEQKAMRDGGYPIREGARAPRLPWKGSKSGKMMKGIRRDPTAGMQAANTAVNVSPPLTATDARAILGDLGITDPEMQTKLMDAVVKKDTSGNKHSYDRDQVATAANAALMLMSDGAEGAEGSEGAESTEGEPDEG